MSEVTLRDLQSRRLKSFKGYVCTNIKDPKLKYILTELSNMPGYVFLTRVHEIITPHRTDLKGFLEKMCAESEIDFSQFEDEIILKIVRYLEYFCKSADEYFGE